MPKRKRWIRDQAGNLMYNATARYDTAHTTERRSTFLTVRLVGQWALCPFCLRPVHLQMERPDGKRRNRWFELHHVVGYQQSAVRFWRGVPVCSKCHIPKLHRRGIWIRDRYNPDNNRNTWAAAQWFRCRYLVAIAIAAVIRTGIRIIQGR